MTGVNTILPHTESEIADAVKTAFASETPLEVIGGGSKRGYGHDIAADQLGLQRFAGIMSYEPEEMIITVRCGTALEEIEIALRAHHQCLAFEPANWSAIWNQDRKTATIGGTVAAAIAGPRRFASGAPRDHLLGFSGINGKGEVFKAGGKVVKNVTGYDLPKLAAGSFGTLFVLAEMTLRAVPAARATMGVCIEGQEPELAFATLRTLSRTPLEPTGLSYLPPPKAKAVLGANSALTLARFEGGDEGVKARASEAMRVCGTGARLMEQEKVILAYDALNDVARLFGPATDLWRLSLPPTGAADAIASLSPMSFVADWAGGLLWLEMAQTYDPADLHGCARKLGGHAHHVRRSSKHAEAKEIFPPMDPATHMITSRLKHAFDPARILNRDRMYRGV